MIKETALHCGGPFLLLFVQHDYFTGKSETFLKQASIICRILGIHPSAIIGLQDLQRHCLFRKESQTRGQRSNNRDALKAYRTIQTMNAQFSPSFFIRASG